MLGSLAHALEPVLAASVFLRVGGPDMMRDRITDRDWLWGLVAAAGPATALSAVLGAGVTVAASDGSPVEACFSWWLAAGLGMLTVPPLLQALGGAQRLRQVRVADVGLVAAAIARGPLGWTRQMGYARPCYPAERGS
jgi:integral membrane sensor domain MASE1